MKSIIAAAEMEEISTTNPMVILREKVRLQSSHNLLLRAAAYEHGTLKFTPAHTNSVLVEKWESLKISYATITQEYFKKKHISPPYLYDKVKNHQACLAATQKYKGRKLGEI